MRVAAVILAGGRSTRMGRDKALLPFRGARLVDHLAELLGGAFEGARIFVSGSIDGYCSVPDIEPGLGPLGGIHSVLTRLAEEGGFDRALFVPVDMPCLTSELLRTLTSGECAHFEGSELPFVVPVSERSIAAARELCRESGSGRSVREFLRRLGARGLAREGLAPEVFRNANTPEEWAAL
ncbi:MAG: molybdenum cofactor guanylyltransferase [Oligoflexia bacterium]|nr:molybdenum cofactor guanylyltransferase [Oligoflexia bacterium]